MIDKSFIEKIEELSKAELIRIGDGDRTFSTKPLSVILAPEAKCLKIHTLSGLADFSLTIVEDTDIIIHVEDYDVVSIVSPLFGSNRQREKFITAEAYDIAHKFNKFLNVEEFIIYLQSNFVQDETTAKIMRVVGNIAQGVEATFADDGVTQRVTAKAGVAKLEVIDLPNPVSLRPFRTFAEIEQPESKFVLRIRANKDEGPMCALYEADGGSWKNAAVANIRLWCSVNMPSACRIIA